MTDQSNDNRGQSDAGSQQADVSRRCHSLVAIVFVVVAALMTVAIEAAHAQSNIEKESNDLLKDIMRKRSPSRQENQEPKATAPKVKAHKSAAPARAMLDKRHVSRKKACPNIVGVWNSWASGIFGKADATFNSDGTALHRSGIAGRWKCEDGKLKISWGGEDEKIFTLSSNRLLSASGMVGFSR